MDKIRICIRGTFRPIRTFVKFYCTTNLGTISPGREEIFMSLLLCSDESEGYCYYSAQERPVPRRQIPWVTYVVITEVGLKPIPSVALATINWNLMKK